MLKEIINFLECPKTKQKLKISQDNKNLVTFDKNYSYKIINKIPRFVENEIYTENFGLQWNEFQKTQLDSENNTTISHDRFYSATGWHKEELKNKWVLDAGCGSGRFAEIALNAGAKVVALDNSSAVDAIQKNFKNHPNLYILQADIYSIPLPENFFDFVYSLGVLQHTPNVEKAFNSLIPVLKPEGKICVDFYWKRFRTVMNSKYFFRPLTKRLPKEILFNFLRKNIKKLLILSNILGKVPYCGFALRKLIPVANYNGIFPLTDKQHIEWSLLDTFDMLSPKYDKPQSVNTIRKIFENANLTDIEIFQAFHLVGRGKKENYK